MLQNRNKTYYNVRGSKIKCINYQKWYLCYRCRRSSSIDPECRKCYEENKKFNICNKDLNRNDVTSKFITKENIKINKVEFKSKKK